MRTVVIYFCMSMFIYWSGVGAASSVNFVDSFVNDSSGQVSVSSSFRDTAPNVDEETSGVGGTLSFLDVLKAARAFINFMTGVLFAIPSLFITAGTPLALQLLVASPFLVIAVISLISFARSGN